MLKKHPYLSCLGIEFKYRVKEIRLLLKFDFHKKLKNYNATYLWWSFVPKTDLTFRWREIRVKKNTNKVSVTLLYHKFWCNLKIFCLNNFSASILSVPYVVSRSIFVFIIPLFIPQSPSDKIYGRIYAIEEKKMQFTSRLAVRPGRNPGGAWEWERYWEFLQDLGDISVDGKRTFLRRYRRPSAYWRVTWLSEDRPLPVRPVTTKITISFYQQYTKKFSPKKI